MKFVPSSVILKGRIILPGPVNRVFHLFSPEGEKLWVPGWNPELLYPQGAKWEEGLLFRTREEFGDAVWVVTQLNLAAHHVTYHRVESGRYVARVEVRCRALPKHRTEARVCYAFVGLSILGNREIRSMTTQAFDEKMKRWTQWISTCLISSSRKPR